MRDNKRKIQFLNFKQKNQVWAVNIVEGRKGQKGKHYKNTKLDERNKIAIQ